MKLGKNQAFFISKTYFTLIFEILVTFYVLYFLINNKNTGKEIQKGILFEVVTILLYIILGLILFYSQKLPIPFRLIIFTLFSAVGGVFLTNISKKINPSIIEQSLIGCIFIFMGCTVLALILAFSGINLSGWGIILIGLLMGLVCSLLIYIIFSHWHVISKEKLEKVHRIILIFGLVLFSIYTIYDTNLLLDKNKGPLTFVDAAINFYFDFVNIFANLIGVES